MIADGISFVTTDKTLTDHGLSLVRDQDCAVWRGIKGDDICTDADSRSGDIMVSELPDISSGGVAGGLENQKPDSSATLMASTKDNSGDISADDFDAENINIAPAPVSDEVPIVPAEARLVKEQLPQPGAETVNPETGGTFYVIASYYKAQDAQRFARQQTNLNSRVLSGTAKGKSVYRVAVGPVTDRQSTKRHLLKSGYHDTWALKQQNPTVIEIASLE